jgi:hypothetical protein
VIESLTTANDGAPGINGQQAPTGAGSSSLAGLLRGYDATHLDEDGTYGHALQGASMYRAKGRWVSPATKSDGPDTSADAIPQGSRLQLNPSFNCGAISTPGIRAYCRTAQKYGIILMDTTPVHALTIYQEDVKDDTPATGNPLAGGYWGTDADWPSLAKVPLDQSGSSLRAEHGERPRSEPLTARTGLGGRPPAHRRPPAPAPRWRR